MMSMCSPTWLLFHLSLFRGAAKLWLSKTVYLQCRAQRQRKGSVFIATNLHNSLSSVWPLNVKNNSRVFKVVHILKGVRLIKLCTNADLGNRKMSDDCLKLFISDWLVSLMSESADQHQKIIFLEQKYFSVCFFFLFLVCSWFWFCVTLCWDGLCPQASSLSTCTIKAYYVYLFCRGLSCIANWIFAFLMSNYVTEHIMTSGQKVLNSPLGAQRLVR